MSKYLALEWDEHEVRLAIAHQRGGAAVLERAFAVPLPLTGEGQSQDAASVAAAIREAIAGDSLRKIETLAVVGRPSIELKELSLPPAPDDELPDMVRFQALRDFTHLADDTPLDYLPLPVEGDEHHRNVLAAAISADLLKEIRATCSQAGLELDHLVLRPCAAASLLCRHRPAPAQIRMFVDLLGDEVDLTVLDRDSPILMRTTRLPGDASQPEYTRPVFLEIRRTIASVQNKLHGRRVEAIALCGDGPSQQMLADLIRTELDLPTEHFDPFTAFELAGGMKKHPERHSRFAPLLGMLADAAAGQRHGIDFLSPRRRPAPKTRRREAAIAVAVLAAVLVVFSLWTWYRLWSLDSEIARLSSEHMSHDKYLKKFKEVPKEAAALDAWTDSDIPWLDVMYRVSTQAPSSEDAMLTALVASTNTTSGTKSIGGGKLHLDGLVGDGKDLDTLESKLRSGLKAKMKVGKVEKDAKGKKYGSKFEIDIDITRAAVEAAQAAAKEAAAKSASVPSKEKDNQKAAAKTEAAKGSAATETKAAGPGAADAKTAPTSDAEKKEIPPPAEVKTLPAESAANAAAPATEVKSESTPAAAPSATPAETFTPAPSPAPATSPQTQPEKKDG